MRHTGTLRASGRPLCAELSGEFARGRLCTPRAFPEDAEPSAGAARWLPECRARWRGRKRRGQCLLLLTKGSSSPAKRPAGLHPASRSRHRRAQRSRSFPASLASCGGLGAGSREPRREAAGGCGEGGGAGGNAAGLGACKAPPCSFGAAGPTSNKWRRTARAQPPPAEPWARARAAREPPRRSGRRSARAVPFVYTLEDTQLRKHRRRHAE